jgi:hypothetical protein
MAPRAAAWAELGGDDDTGANGAVEAEEPEAAAEAAEAAAEAAAAVEPVLEAHGVTAADGL